MKQTPFTLTMSDAGVRSPNINPVDFVPARHALLQTLYGGMRLRIALLPEAVDLVPNNQYARVLFKHSIVVKLPETKHYLATFYTGDLCTIKN